MDTLTLTPEEQSVITEIGIDLFKELVAVIKQYADRGIDFVSLLDRASKLNDLDFDQIVL